MTDFGRVGKPTGLSSPTEPASSLGPTGFDPSRVETCALCGRRRFEHGGTWCYPFVPKVDAQ